MPVRIEKLRVKRGGPLKEDFSMDPGDLNLLYGLNESGKTYLVEAMISFLFGFRSGTNRRWEHREWSPSGKAVISGLGEDTIDFTKSKTKLDDLWIRDTGLPPDIPRLLVIRAGDTRLSSGSGGVDNSILRSFLSGEQTLEQVTKRIDRYLLNASVEDGIIKANRTAGLKKRKQYQEKLEILDRLMQRLDADLDRGAVHSMNMRRVTLQEELDGLDLARRYTAGQLDEKLTKLRDREDALPDQDDLADAELEVRSLAEKRGKLESLGSSLADLKASVEESRWVKHATEVYSTVTDRSGKSRQLLMLLLTIILLTGSVAFGLIGLQIPTILCAVGSVIAILVYHASSSSAEESIASGEVLKISRDFESRFGRPLKSIADLNAVAEELSVKRIRSEELERQATDLEGSIAMHEAGMNAFFCQHGLEVPPPDEWGSALADMRILRKQLNSECRETEKRLTGLGVPGEDYYTGEPPVDWNPERYGELTSEVEKLDEMIAATEQEETSLKHDLASETDLDISSSWEDLRTALQDKREETAGELRGITAYMLSRICVKEVLMGFRSQERVHMEEALADDSISDPLLRITGVYTGVSLGDDDRLMLSKEDGESFPLDQLSTGALEQVHIALRTSFASNAIGDTAFLVFDDAFQHSDWHRRQRMVDYALSLVQQGWQVFYFTMDDHLRGLFQKAGDKLGSRFTSTEI